MRTVTGLFDTYEHAANAVHALKDAGIKSTDISFIANSPEDIEQTDAIGEGATTGAELGAVLGGAGGLLAGLGLLAVPGLGPVVASGWLFAATDKGVYRAMDCFCGFRLAGSLPGPVSAVAYDPKQPKELYAAVGRDVFSTANGGEDWQAVASPAGEIGALVYSPSGVLYALLADGRVVRSTDKGRQWE